MKNIYPFYSFTLYFNDKNLWDTVTRSFFLVVFISFYISRFFTSSFSQIFRTLFNIVGFTQTPTPFPLMTKICSVWQKFFVHAPFMWNSWTEFSFSINETSCLSTPTKSTSESSPVKICSVKSLPEKNVWVFYLPDNIA